MILRFYKVVKACCFPDIFFIKGLSLIEIKAELDATFGESVPTFTSAKIWVANFKHDCMSPQGAERYERQKSSTMEEVIQIVHKGFMNDHQLKLTDLAEIAVVLKKQCIIP